MKSGIAKTIILYLFPYILPLICPLPVMAVVGMHMHAAVKVVRIPNDWLVPDVVMDGKSVLHMVYARNGNAYYVQSYDDGAIWTIPVKVNKNTTVEYRMGERGPKMSIGVDGVIHVVWEDYWSPGVKTYVRYARSANGGRSFGSELSLSTMSGVDGVSLSADKMGDVWAFWHVSDPPQSTTPDASWLWMALSSNNGESFKSNHRIEISNLIPLACSMCMMSPQTDKNGYVYLAFRSAVDSIRDFYVLKSSKPWNHFTAIRVNRDNWKQSECPMCGPNITFTPNGDILCSFMSRNKVYWSEFSQKTNGFELHVATPDNQVNERYPFAKQNRSGNVLFLWQVGPMSTDGSAIVKWAVYRSDGKYEGIEGVAGIGSSGTKPTAFIGKNNDFYIITSAR